MKLPHTARPALADRPILLPLMALCLHSQASGAAGDVDLSFDPGSGINGAIHAIALQADGKIIVGGAYMTRVRGVACQNIARLHGDGSGDPSFDAGWLTGFGDIRALALQPDGKVLVGFNGGISRLNQDGSADVSFIAPGVTDYGGSSSGIGSIAIQPDGKILIGGGFRVVDGALRSGIARLNADGSLDDAFVPDTSDNFYAGVFSIALQPDGKVIIGGQSMTVNNASIARLNTDGSLDFSFNPGNVNDAVWSLSLQSDGKVLIGGTFTVVNGTNRNAIARLDTNGILDTSFEPASGSLGGLYSIALQPDGKVLFAGYDNTYRNRLARLHADGRLDTAFDAGPGPHPNILVMAVQMDGQILAGGAPGRHHVAEYNILTRLDGDGGRDSAFGAGGGLDGRVHSVVAQPDGKVLVGGVFGYVNGTRRSGLARLNVDGSLDGTFIPDPSIHGNVMGIAQQPDGKVLIGGFASTEEREGTVRGGIARLHADGSLDSSFDPGTGANWDTRLIVLQPDGKIFIAGGFDTVNGITRKALARLNFDGSVDGAFNCNIDGYTKVNSVAVQPDGKVLVGGSFSVGSDPKAYSLARLNADGSLDSSFSHASTEELTDIEAYTVLLQSDGKILVQGVFQIDGWTGANLVRLNVDGSLDSAFHPGSSTDVYGPIASQPDGKVLLAGGLYGRVNGETIVGPCRLNADGSLDSSFSFTMNAPSIDGGVDSIVLQPDGSVLVVGGFIEIQGVFRQYVARLYGDLVMPALSIDRSGSQVILSWPMTSRQVQLQETTDLSRPDSWSPVAQPAMTDSDRISVTVPISTWSRFFRLKSP